VIAAKDFEKFMSYYADDASELVPNTPVVNGKDAIRAAWKPFFDDPNSSLAFQASRVEVAKSGDLGYAQGAYTETTTDPKTKKPVTDKGKYVTVYKKQADGSRKVVADIWNTDMPLPAPGKKAPASKKK
jgi:uncharacterized protein (TIGR02246 family)